ncbi:MAG: HAD family hydrolase [Peptococcia bacterium]|jgi:HAD superfamily hydrolase (TIGR01509 family)
MKGEIVKSWKVKGAIFDLDGTLIDSLGVWKNLDKDFLKKRGFTVPQDIDQVVKNLSFQDAAVYFKEKFHLSQTIAEIMEEWNRMVFDEYAFCIGLKPGVREYLIYLETQGIKIGLATSNTRKLTEVVLRNNGVYDYFEVIKTGDEVERDKNFPDIYLLCAQGLQLEPGQCVVFEDILPGILSAKTAGMKTVRVYDQYSKHEWEEIKMNADLYISSFEELTERGITGVCQK